MRITLLFSILFSLLNMDAYAQVKLKMDKFGRVKSLDYNIGDEITVRLKGEDGFHTLFIKDLNPEANLIITQLGPIHINQIERIRTFKVKKLGKLLRYQLWTFGLGWGVYSVIAALFLGEPWLWGTLVVVGVAFLLGWLFGFIFRHKTYKIGGKRKVRIEDHTFYKPIPRS